MKTRTLLLGVAAAFIIFGRAGQGILANYDDCYYAEKAKEMLHDGDWLTPHFAGHVRLDNPPLFLWLITAGFRIFGVGKLGAVIVSAAAGVCSVLLLVRVARRLGFDEFEALSAGAILLTTQYFLKYAQHAMMDVILTLVFLLAIDGYLSAADGKRSGWLRLGLFTGVGVLLKSVLGLFPLIVAALHRLTVRGRPAIFERGPWIAAAAAAVVAAPWYAYQLSVHPGQLVSEHFQWLILSRGLGEAGPEGLDSGPLYYLTRIATVYWPWLPFTLYGLRLAMRRAVDRDEAPDRRSAAALVLLWLGVVVGVMSVAHVRKLWYVMSVFPCLALLSAKGVSRLLGREPVRRRAMTSAGIVLALLAVMIAFTPIGTAHPRQPGLHRMALAARSRVRPGDKVLNLDARYWDVANVFLFYSDRDLTEPLFNPATIREELRRGRWALLRPSRVAEVVGDDAAAFDVAAQSEDWVLIGGGRR